MKQDFEWLEVIGRGMSGVCRKVRAKDGTIMVVKQIDISFVTPEEYQSATREARLLSSISHPNVIRFFDEFVDDEMLHIVMEFAPYGTLKQNLAKMTGLIPESSAVWIMLNIINGLDFLHQRKIVHRDLKSDNIFIGHQHVPKVGDFGVATRLNSAQPMAVSVVGTPLYLSPELCNGQPYNTKTDMWAIGILVYEVCSKGRLPFAAGNQGAVIKKILMGQYSPLSKIYSSEVHTMLDECLSQDPRHRPTAHEMQARLDTLYQAHMRQEEGEPPDPTSLTEPSVPGASDHFTLASKKTEQGRARKQPLWWEWASNQGFVTGKFRTLYGGTPHASPTHRARDRGGVVDKMAVGDSAGAGGGHGAKGSLGSILPFMRQGSRPTSAPSTPSTSGSLATRREAGKTDVLDLRRAAGKTGLLDFLVSTPAILEGPLQGPLWRNPKSKANAHGRAHTPLTPPTRYGFAKRDMSHTNDDSMMVSPVDGQRCAHLHLDARQHAQGGARPPMMQLAFTTVDDLTGWLQHNAHELALDTPGEEEGVWTRDKSARPTSSPDCSRSGARRALVKGSGISSLLPGQGLSTMLPPSRVTGFRLGVAERGSWMHNNSSFSNSSLSNKNPANPANDHLQPPLPLGAQSQSIQQPLYAGNARRKPVLQLAVNGVQPLGAHAQVVHALQAPPASLLNAALESHGSGWGHAERGHQNLNAHNAQRSEERNSLSYFSIHNPYSNDADEPLVGMAGGGGKRLRDSQRDRDLKDRDRAHDRDAAFVRVSSVSHDSSLLPAPGQGGVGASKDSVGMLHAGLLLQGQGLNGNANANANALHPNALYANAVHANAHGFGLNKNAAVNVATSRDMVHMMPSRDVPQRERDALGLNMGMQSIKGNNAFKGSHLRQAPAIPPRPARPPDLGSSLVGGKMEYGYSTGYESLKPSALVYDDALATLMPRPSC